MAVKLNLLPSDYAITGPVEIILKIIRPLNVTLLALFLVTALGMSGFFVFSSISLNNLNKANENLVKQIEVLQPERQQIVLLKDRLGKIAKVLALPSASKNLNSIVPLITTFGEKQNIKELDLDSQSTALTLDFKSNSDFDNFIKNLSSMSDFSSITLDSFGYNSISGYSVRFLFAGK
jgi:hypothetical protein